MPPPSSREPGSAKDPQFAYTLAKGLDVLRAFEGTAPSMGNAELASRTGLTRPTVSRLTRTLTLLGYLQYNKAEARYRLAASTLALGYPLLSRLSLRQLARGPMQALADQARGAVSIAMRSGLKMFIVESCVDQSAANGRPDIGAARPIASTSLGHAYYSAAPSDEKLELALALRREAGLDWPALEALLARSQAQFDQHGHCVRAKAPDPIVAVSVPIRAPGGGETLVMNCAVASFNLEGDALTEQIAPRLMHLVHQLERSMGLP